MNPALVKKLKAVPQPRLQRDPNEFTTYEFMQEFGLGRTAAKERLSKLVRSGAIVPVKVTYQNTRGIITSTSGYRYVGDEDAGRGRTEGA